MSEPTTTNRKFAETSGEFRQACEAAGVQATKRQASKFRMGKGRAFAARKGGD